MIIYLFIFFLFGKNKKGKKNYYIKLHQLSNYNIQYKYFEYFIYLQMTYSLNK